MKTQKSYEILERITRKWWLYLLLFAILFFVPLYSSTSGFIMNEKTSELIAEILTQSLKPYKTFMPILHIIVILLIAIVLIYGNRIGKSLLLSFISSSA